MKRLLTLIIAFSMVLCLTGCNDNSSENISKNSTETSSFENTSVDSELNSEEIENPELIFSQVYNPNGINTFTGIIHNPNNIAIDSTFDVVYYKDNVEVGRSCECFASPVEANGDYVVFYNYEIPKPEDVDMVRLENFVTYKTYYTPIKATYSYVDDADGYANFKFKFEKSYTCANVWFLLYNDTNKNDKLDNGELIVTDLESHINGEENFRFATDVFNYEKYEVYYSAY